MTEEELKKSLGPYSKLKLQRWISDNKQNTLWRINGSDPIPESFIVINNGKPRVQSYWDAIIGEKANGISTYSLENGDHILSKTYTDSLRDVDIKELWNRVDYEPKFGEISYGLFDYSMMKDKRVNPIHPTVLEFENGSKFDVLQLLGKELLLYIFPNVSVIGMYSTEELKVMKLEQVQMLDKEYLKYLEQYNNSK